MGVTVVSTSVTVSALPLPSYVYDVIRFGSVICSGRCALVVPFGPHFQSFRIFSVAWSPRTASSSVYGPVPHASSRSFEGFLRPSGQMTPAA